MTLNSESLTNQLAELMDNRNHVYAVLSRCYETEITQEFANEMVNSFVFDCDDKELTEDFNQLRAFLTNLSEKDIEELAVVFDRVFFGMGPLAAKKAFPYESVYTSEQGLMMQRSYEQVCDIYASAGFVKNQTFTEPEDHIAVELAFLACLAEKTAEYARNNDLENAEICILDQISFLDNHIHNWVNLFAQDMLAAEGEGFYAWLMKACVQFVTYDRALLQSLVN